MIIFRADQHQQGHEEIRGHEDGQSDHHEDKAAELEEEVEAACEEHGCCKEGGNGRVGNGNAHLFQGSMGPIRPRPCWCVVVGVEQVHRVVHRQAHRGDHEDALVLTQAPSEEGHDSQEGRRDTNDANQAQGRRPPVPCGRQQNDPANQKGQADAHGGCLDHLITVVMILIRIIIIIMINKDNLKESNNCRSKNHNSNTRSMTLGP